MKVLARKPFLFPVVLLASLATGAPQANAQSLFQNLFGGGVRSLREDDSGYQSRRNRFDDSRYGNEQKLRKPQERAVRKAAPVAKISAPSYYNYKAIALQRVDFTQLASIGQSASLDQVGSGTAFREAAAGLAGYELLAEPEIAKALVEYYSANPDFIWVTGDDDQRSRPRGGEGSWRGRELRPVCRRTMRLQFRPAD